ncbi:hypothetical protein KHQ81_12545 [Mycoplasmatota bacterium]|nr:hypothetical protein KHQ81_12545 [Mycoplasmatota bacterium]
MKNSLIILIIIIIISILSGCDKNNNEPLESGFIYKNVSDKPSQSNFCGYSSSVNEFQIDEVELNFFIGISEIAISTSIFRIEKIQIYAQNKNLNEKVILTEIDDFQNDTFKFDKLIINNSSYKINYKYSIKINLPKELFEDSSGKIEIGFLALINYDSNVESVSFKTWDFIYYRKVNDKILLSNE